MTHRILLPGLPADYVAFMLRAGARVQYHNMHLYAHACDIKGGLDATVETGPQYRLIDTT